MASEGAAEDLPSTQKKNVQRPLAAMPCLCSPASARPPRDRATR